jgi:RNA polymerase sigma factor (sigma-70 family)
MLTVALAENRDRKISGWFAEYGNRILRFVKSRVNDVQEAEDIAQDVWFQLSRLEDITSLEQAGAWLFTAAKNKVINFYKKKKNIPFSKLQNDADEDSDVFDHWVSDFFTDEEMESDEFWQTFNRALSAIPAEQREVFIANEMHDISFKEMAEITGIPINTLIARKRYAVQKLREEFSSYLN